MKNSMNISLSPVLSDYELLDSGDFEKLERFGRYVTRRPEPQAIWHRSLTEEAAAASAEINPLPIPAGQSIITWS